MCLTFNSTSCFRQTTLSVLSGNMGQVATILDNTTKYVCTYNVSQTKIEHSNTLFYILFFSFKNTGDCSIAAHTIYPHSF